MTPTDLRKRSEQLYGQQWQAELSRRLVRDRRTIRRWASGKSPVPRAVEEWLKRQRPSA